MPSSFLLEFSILLFSYFLSEQMQQTTAASSLKGTNKDTPSFVELEIARCILNPEGLRERAKKSSSPSLGVKYCPKTQMSQPSRTNFTFQLQF